MKYTHLVLAITSFTGLASAQGPTVGGCPVFPADNIWNTRIDQLPVSPSSTTWVTTIGATSPLHPDFGSGLYNGNLMGIPFVTVPGTQTKFPATFDYPTESDPGPYAIPLNAPIEPGDGHAIGVDATNCVLYELFSAVPQAASWKAGSGAIFHLNSQALRPATWTSADAAGLPIWPGLVRYDEIAAGAIHHAIRFTVPHTQRAFVWPARHYASSLTGGQYPPMGARFRLKAGFDTSKFSAVNQIILKALKQYGMMLADNGSSWYISGAPDPRWNNDDLHILTTLHGSDFEAVDVSPLMIDPNSGQARQTTVFVNVAPTAAPVQVDKQKQFTATVIGDANQSVTWDVNGTIGGYAAVGFIDSISGLYTAPASVPTPPTVTIHATSKAVAAVVGSASVTITPPPPPPVTISISPTVASVAATKTVQFKATVKNTANTAVVWKVNGVVGGNATKGTVSAAGLYTAPGKPASVKVSATSVADGTKTATASVTVHR